MPVYVSAHFLVTDLQCHCGCGTMPHEDFIHKLEALRVVVGHPMVILSGARCAKHNKAVSTTGDTGPHVPDPTKPECGAVDFLCWGTTTLDFLRQGPDLGWHGYGLMQHGPSGKRWMHMDNWPATLKPRPGIWTYGGGGGE